jgi:hypothetical protein
MARSYAKRLKIPLEGRYKLNLYSNVGAFLSHGYNRVVLGKRGPYVEFTEAQIIISAFHIPEEEQYRLTNGVSFYVEYRSNDAANVKLYFQKRGVSYADYKIGLYYISPFDLFMEYGIPTIV